MAIFIILNYHKKKDTMNIIHTQLLLVIALTCSTGSFGMNVRDLILDTHPGDDSPPIIRTYSTPGLYSSDLRQHVSGKLYATIDPNSGQKSYGAGQLPSDLLEVHTKLVVSETDHSFAFWSIDTTPSLLRKQPHLTQKQIEVISQNKHNILVIVDEHHKYLLEINQVVHIKKNLASQISAANHWMNKNSDVAIQAQTIIEQLALAPLLLVQEFETLNKTHEKCDENIAEKDALLKQYEQLLTQARQKNTDLKTEQSKENLKRYEEKKAFETRIDELIFYKKAYTLFLRATKLALGSYLIYLLACKITK